MAEEAPGGQELWVKITKGGKPTQPGDKGSLRVTVYESATPTGPEITGDDESQPPAGETAVAWQSNPICFWFNGKRYCR